MASRTFLLLALAFAVVLLITSEVAAAKELASDNDSEINDSGRLEHKTGEVGYNKGSGGKRGNEHDYGRGGHGGGKRGNDSGGGHRSCSYGCCGGGRYNKGGCKCCSTFEEATAYKQTQN